ncbi:uncharacterized protein J4E78_003655 [Alternaria triticimaculans]|uniref:uncharacterized protein n=1 Tax=Alternaria triticimaculans TaxID=297637 RepID=UPI0020C5008C|nr:uncharacterized protein J4E78_003655 [Alternaria triticimaculans]KAI4663244.1 hypothetical protein J4E78_003655 [Alternaria triticimaculans]
MVRTKKRRKSQSPARGTTSKRARVSSPGVSQRTRHEDHDPHSSRAGSVKDTYSAQRQNGSTSLPTGEDWVFRVKVISSATDLRDDLFRNAVQGLVRICFPDGILDQLGPQVLEQHMREENAPERNIERMSEIFQSEMTQRMASMLALHLDTASKLDTVVKNLLVASARAHGNDFGDDVLGHLTASLLKLKTRTSGHSTEWLAGSDAAQEVDSDGRDTSNSDDSEAEPTPPPKSTKKKNKRHEKEVKTGRSSDEVHVAKPAKTHSSSSAALRQQRIQRRRDRKISSKWQWDANAQELSDNAIARIFSRTSDLFAYHALPISKRKLGPDATLSQLGREMQSLLDDMPAEEFEKWVESLQKLLDGDRDMLERQEIRTSADQQQSTRATPAPIETRRRSRKATKDTSDSLSYPGSDPDSASRPSRPEAVVKLEAVTNLTKLPENDQRKSLSEATTTFRNPATEKRLVQAARQVIEEVKGRKTRSHGSQLDEAPWVEDQIPITMLLWGKSSVTRSQRLDIARTIMDNLHRRSPADVRLFSLIDMSQLIRFSASEPRR